MIGIIGNQENKTRNAPSSKPETNPPVVVLKPPDALTFDNPLMTLVAKMNKKTIKSQSFITGTSKRNFVFFINLSNRFSLVVFKSTPIANPFQG